MKAEYDKYLRIAIISLIVVVAYFVIKPSKKDEPVALVKTKVDSVALVKRKSDSLAAVLDSVLKASKKVNDKKSSVKIQPKEKPKKAAVVAKADPRRLYNEDVIRGLIVSNQGKYLHLREKLVNGRYTNRGAAVEAIQKRAGMPIGQPWCGAYMFCLFADFGIDVKKDFGVLNPSGVRYWFTKADRIVYRSGSGNMRNGIFPRKGDVMSLFASHIEMYNGDDWIKDMARKKIPTGGGNTGGNFGVHGVYVTTRDLKDVKLIANHLTPYYEAI